MKRKKLIILAAGILIALCLCMGQTALAKRSNNKKKDDATTSSVSGVSVDKVLGAENELKVSDDETRESDETTSSETTSVGESVVNFIGNTGFAHMFTTHCDNPYCVEHGNTNHLLNCVMILIAFVLLILAIVKGFEPLLLVPIAIGMLLTNVSIIGHDPIYHSEIFINSTLHINWEALANEGSLIDYLYIGVKLGIYPSLIFIGVGAMTDFGPLIANPKSLLLGAAAQVGIFITFIGAVYMDRLGIPGLSFIDKEAASIGIIGGADGPTAIYVTTKLAPQILPAVAIAAYSYMALVPVIQPPIMRLLTTKEERRIVMNQLKPVSKAAKMFFPIVVTAIVALLVPSATPLVGALMFGNLLRESGVTERLSKTAQNELMNIVTIFLGISVGATASAANFLNPKTLGILLLGVIAFSFGTGGGVLLAKFMNLFSKNKINPLIGSAGVSAVPMAARVSQIEGQKEDPSNFLLMHAMGPNVAGVIGSAIAAGALISMFGG